jgi:hypothetical protein
VNIKIKNEYIVEGMITRILWASKKTKMNFEILVDTKNLQKILDIGYSIFCKWHEDGKNYYPVITEYKGFIEGKPRNTVRCLHSYLIDCPEGYNVDHINHNTMDNREDNFRVILKKDNLKNRKTKNRNNKSGYRNVSLIEGKYIVQLQVEGKNTRLGSFDDAHKAGVFAEEMRKKYYGEFAGGN